MSAPALYDVYALGNALVDLEFHLNDKELLELGIEKGCMQLIDDDQRLHLLSSLSSYQAEMYGGGSAANTLVALAQLGASPFFSCQISQDQYGHFYAQDLLSHQVSSNLLDHAHKGIHTGTCLVIITPDAQRSMATHLGCSSRLAIEVIDIEALKQSRLFYMEGYLSSSSLCFEASLFAKKIAQQEGLKTALTLSDVNMIRFFKNELDAMIGDGVDILLCNEQEALAFTNTTDLNQAAQSLLKLAQQVCITLGPMGCLVSEKNEFHLVKAPTSKAIDTNGAGDIFAGAFIYGLQQNASAQKAAAFANQVASFQVTQKGTRLKPDQMKTFLS